MTLLIDSLFSQGVQPSNCSTYCQVNTSESGHDEGCTVYRKFYHAVFTHSARNVHFVLFIEALVRALKKSYQTLCSAREWKTYFW